MKNPIKIVKGNGYHINIPVEQIMKTTEGFDVSKVNLYDWKAITVNLVRRGVKYPVNCKIENENTLRVTVEPIVDGEEFSVGMYGIEIYMLNNQNTQYKFYDEEVIDIVNTTEEADVPTNVEFNIDQFDLAPLSLYISQKGDKGDKGDDGTVSFDELTPNQIAMLRGERGEAGQKGDKGEKGDKGDTGAMGEKGDTGEKGEKGDKGDKGDNGIVPQELIDDFKIQIQQNADDKYRTLLQCADISVKIADDSKKMLLQILDTQDPELANTQEILYIKQDIADIKQSIGGVIASTNNDKLVRFPATTVPSKLIVHTETQLLQEGSADEAEYNNSIYLSYGANKEFPTDYLINNMFCDNVEGGECYKHVNNNKKDLNVEYIDEYGNYASFKAEVKIQGDSTKLYPSKNLSIKIKRGELIEQIQFGDWCPTRKIHLKRNYIDSFRGIGYAIGKYISDVIESEDAKSNRNNIPSSNEYYTTKDKIDSLAMWYQYSAKCVPDGFPVEVYVAPKDGDPIYHGLFTISQPVSVDTFGMVREEDEKTIDDCGKNIIIGGTLSKYFWDKDTYDSDPTYKNKYWSEIEIKSPEEIVYANGNAYDNDIPGEIYSGDSDENIEHQRSRLVYDKIQQLRSVYSIYQSSKSDIEKKREIDAIIDTRATIMYLILSEVICNIDGIEKNWIWTNYGGKWAPNFHDLDVIFGRYWDGTFIEKGREDHLLKSMAIQRCCPLAALYDLYKDEINTLYFNLRESGLISVNNIIRYIDQWQKHVGIAAYQKDIKNTVPGTECPSGRDGHENTKVWERVKSGVFGVYEVERNYIDEVYDPNKTYYKVSNNPKDKEVLYLIGEKNGNVYSNGSYYLKYRCVSDDYANEIYKAPLLPGAKYKYYPNYMGVYDSKYRVKNWLTTRISVLDKEFIPKGSTIDQRKDWLPDIYLDTEETPWPEESQPGDGIIDE